MAQREPQSGGDERCSVDFPGNCDLQHSSADLQQVFKDNAETLREAFIKSGFDAAEFDVAFNNGSQFNQNMNFGSQNDGTSLLAKHVYNNAAGGLDSELEDIFQNAEDISNYSVNIVA